MNAVYQLKSLARRPQAEEVSGDMKLAITDLVEVLLGPNAARTWAGAMVQTHPRKNLWRLPETTDFGKLWQEMLAGL